MDSIEEKLNFGLIVLASLVIVTFLAVCVVSIFDYRLGMLIADYAILSLVAGMLVTGLLGIVAAIALLVTYRA